MREEDLEKFTQNVEWFNQFFQDVHLVFEKISKRLANVYALGDPSYYYPKAKSIPDIPPYYMMGQGGEHFAVQVFAIIESRLLQDQRAFRNEPSLFVCVHSRGDRALWPEEYGLRVASNRGVTIRPKSDHSFSGQILEDPPVRYRAFQVPFNRVASREEVLDVIDKGILIEIDQFLKEGG